MATSELPTHRAREILAAVERLYPTAWSDIDRVRTLRRKGAVPDWPVEDCFFPLFGVHALMSGSKEVPTDRLHHIALIAALAAWRVTQGIYRFDPDVYRVLITTPLDRELPHDVLYGLPEWCVYIETPRLRWQLPGEDRPIHGAWAFVNCHGSGKPDELRLVLDTSPSPDDALDEEQGSISVPIYLDGGSIRDSIRRMFEENLKSTLERGLDLPPLAVREDPSLMARLLYPIVFLALYLCVAQADIGDGARKPTRPDLTKTRRGFRYLPPRTPTLWDVGLRMGAALRGARDGHESKTEGATSMA
jgi:hypothetical protein